MNGRDHVANLISALFSSNGELMLRAMFFACKNEPGSVTHIFICAFKKKPKRPNFSFEINFFLAKFDAVCEFVCDALYQIALSW